MKCCTSEKVLLKGFLCFLLAFSLLCGMGTRGFALEGETAADPRVDGEELNIWADSVSAGLVRYGSRTKVTLAAPESPRMYFYPYLYMSGEYDWTGYGVFALWMGNTGSDPLKINFTLTDFTRNNYRLNDSDSILALREGESMAELVSPVFGLLELEPGFKGEIYIPVDGIPEASLRSVVSFGVTIAVPRETSASLELADARLISEPMSIPGFRVNGPQTVRIPAMGEAVARYDVDFGEEKYLYGAAFRLEGEPEGISLTGDGILTVNENARPGSIAISAAAGGAVKRKIRIELLESRGDIGFPEPDGAARLANVDDPFFDDRILYGVRAACVMIALLLLVLYLWWKKRDRRIARHEKSQS